MRSDNNKPWGTHRTVEIPPAQLEPRDPWGGIALEPTKSKGIHTQEETQNSLALPPPLCEWSSRQAQPRCCSVPSQAGVAVEGKEIAPCWVTPAAPFPSLCASRAAHPEAGAGFGASATKHSEITRSAHHWLQQEWNGTQFHS